MRLIALTLLTCFALALGACGQKGPLTLPDKANANTLQTPS